MVLRNRKGSTFKIVDNGIAYHYMRKENFLKHKYFMVKGISSPLASGGYPQSINKYLKGGKTYE